MKLKDWMLIAFAAIVAAPCLWFFIVLVFSL